MRGFISVLLMQFHWWTHLVLCQYHAVFFLITIACETTWNWGRWHLQQLCYYSGLPKLLLLFLNYNILFSSKEVRFGPYNMSMSVSLIYSRTLVVESFRALLPSQCDLWSTITTTSSSRNIIKLLNIYIGSSRSLIQNCIQEDSAWFLKSKLTWEIQHTKCPKVYVYLKENPEWLL